MKSNKFLGQLNEKSVKELVAELSDKKKELFNLRFQLATNQLENPMRVKSVKKEIAQINTIIKQKQLAQE